MVDRTRLRLLSGALASVILPALAGCVRPLAPGPAPGYPPHYYDYYYYPHEEVYFHVYTGDYYYREGSIWWRSRTLPPHIHLDPGYRFWLRIWDDKPWRRHHEHRRRFPPPPRPAHYYDYWYYPDWRIYFHISTGWYYYHDAGRWHRVRRLPPHIHLDWGRRHLLNIRDPEPWRRHEEHRRRYPPRAEPGRVAPPEPRRVAPPEPRRVAPPSRPERRVAPPEPRRVAPPEPRRVAPPEPRRVAPPEPRRVAPPEPRRVTPPQPRRVAPPEPRRVAPPEPRRVAPPEPRRVAPPSPPERRVAPPARAEPPPPAEHQRDRARDREEREHNIRRHQEYRNKPR